MKTASYKFFVILSTVILIVFLLIYFLYRYIKTELSNYELYEDFSRSSIIMLLSFNKELDIQFSTIRDVQKMTTDYKVSKGDLIKDFADYDFIPVLSYLKESSENEYLIKAFEDLSDFISDFNLSIMNDREMIFVHYNDGKKRYRIENNTYIYDVQKEVIGKNTFHKIYSDFMKESGSKEIKDHMIKLLLKNEKIKSEYNYDSLAKQIDKDYLNFYSLYEEEIILAISSDLKEFSAYLYDTYIEQDTLKNELPKLKKTLETETVNLEFKVYRNDREYTGASKYYLYNYIVDLNDVWRQLKDLNYPKLYM